MKFSEFLSQAWSQHGDHAETVAENLGQGLSLCASPEDLVALVHLTTHLYSEHLHRFVEGERRLREFGKSDFANGTVAEFAIARSAMAFRLCEGTVDPATDRLGLTPGDLARTLAVAASALALRDSKRSHAYLHLATETVASLELNANDGIARALAIAGNNMAANFEDLETRNPEQTELMLLASKTARRFWQIAGTWLEVERAEYRVAKSHLKAGLVQEARHHAEACLAICEQNAAAPLEFFFAYECLASVARAAPAGAGSADARSVGAAAIPAGAAKDHARAWFEKMDPEDQTWARSSLDRLG